MIFRKLYERIAEALAEYENVSVKRFLDESEEERFWGKNLPFIRYKAKSLKLTVRRLASVCYQSSSDRTRLRIC